MFENGQSEQDKVNNNVMFVLRLMEINGMYFENNKLSEEAKIHLLNVTPDRQYCYDVITELKLYNKLTQEQYLALAREIDKYCDVYGSY